jgi:RHS repeat-associated protein
MTNAAGQSDSYFCDGNGNVTDLTDAYGVIAAHYQYDPFGNVVAQTGSLQQPYQWSSKETDASTGLVSYLYRFYNPSLGRWQNRDPLLELGSVVHYDSNTWKTNRSFGLQVRTSEYLNSIARAQVRSGPYVSDDNMAFVTWLYSVLRTDTISKQTNMTPREAIRENEGINLYDYVFEDPLSKCDPYGLYGGSFSVQSGSTADGGNSVISVGYSQTCPKKQRCAHIQFIQIVSDNKMSYIIDYPYPKGAPPENAYPFFEWGHQSSGLGLGLLSDQPGGPLLSTQDFETCAVCMETGRVLGCTKWGVTGLGGSYGITNSTGVAPSNTFQTVTGYR